MESRTRAGDLCIRPPDAGEAARIVEEAYRLGYRLLGIEADDEAWTSIVDACRSLGIKCVRRATLRARSTGEIKRLLRELRGFLIAVEAESLEIARFAARDGRVGIIVARSLRHVDRSEARLLQQGGGVVEFMLPRGAGDLSFLLRGMRRAAHSGIPFILSSCASTVWELWHPLQAASLASLARLPVSLGLEAVYVNPFRVVRP